MRDELRPCPFCGSEADTTTLAYGSLVVRCPSVNCLAFDDWRDLEDWNHRPIEDALRADLAQQRKENADLLRQLGEYDAIRAKQVRYEMYLNDEPSLPALSGCLKGCIGDIQEQYPAHAWGLSFAIENIEAMIIDRTKLRAELNLKNELVKALDELVEALQIYPLHFQSSIDARESARAKLAALRGEQ